MNGITKNQHFVPQLLLRHFATGAEEEVQIFDSKRGRGRISSIRRVFSQNYFYDNDNVIEKFLAEKIEGPATSIVNSIVADPTQVISQGHPELLFFVAVQMARTPGTQAQALSLIESFSNMLFQQIAELNGIPAEEIQNLKLRFNDERVLINHQMLRSTTNRWLLEDLSWHVLRNDTDLPFVIADHPSVQYNWYLRNSDDPSHTALTKHGVQIFLPLSPAITLALIDKTIYKFGEKGSSHTVLTERRDVELLNSLQFRSRQDFIVFPVGMDSAYVKRKCDEIPANSLTRSHAGKTDPVPVADGKLSSHVYVWRTQERYPEWLSVSKVKRRISKASIECRDRRPEDMAAQRAAASSLFNERMCAPSDKDYFDSYS